MTHNAERNRPYNWETQQVAHVMAGNYAQNDHWLWLEIAAEEMENEDGNKEFAVKSLADRMQYIIEDEVPTSEGLYGTLLMGALSEVDWQELSRDLIENLEDQ